MDTSLEELKGINVSYLRCIISDYINDEQRKIECESVLTYLLTVDDGNTPQATHHHSNFSAGMLNHIATMCKLTHYLESQNEILREMSLNRFGGKSLRNNIINWDLMYWLCFVHDLDTVDYYNSGEKGLDHFVNAISKASMVLGRQLTSKEQNCIMSHHGLWGATEPKSVEASLFHCIDNTCAQILEPIVKKDSKYQIIDKREK